MKKLIPVVAATALGLAGCANTPSNNAADNDTLQVMASFYPLQFVAEQVGGEHVTVTSMTPAGGEAHDLELSPKTVAQMEQADVIVYLHGFQPAVDAAIAEADLAHIYDAKADANLIAIGGSDGSE
ncbi:MAG: zinc ABC transporter substrate-binding protein, partial [Bowdeniella nasicola]|nr:zinc ABC transporter substrate-binding protein [Bowdeniella nasicola]